MGSGTFPHNCWLAKHLFESDLLVTAKDLKTLLAGSLSLVQISLLARNPRD